MTVIDEEGNLFGVVNAVDVFVAAVVIALLAGGFWVVLSSPEQSTTEVTIHVRIVEEPFVVEAVSVGPVPYGNVRQVESVRVRKRVVTENRSQELLVVDVVVVADAEMDEEGRLYLQDERLYVGRELRLDLGETIVDATVVAVERGR